MNVLFFLTPKSEVAHLQDDWTVRQGIEKMERSGYTALPLIDREGHYIGTVSEGDFLRLLKRRYDMNTRSAEAVSILAVKRRADIRPVSVDATMEDLVRMAMNQNFVPVIDDNQIFIGIVTRKDIIRFCYEKYVDKQSKE